MHLLIVEDERALCDTVARSLRRSAYSVDCCYDGEKALELLETVGFGSVWVWENGGFRERGIRDLRR